MLETHVSPQQTPFLFCSLFYHFTSLRFPFFRIVSILFPLFLACFFRFLSTIKCALLLVRPLFFLLSKLLLIVAVVVVCATCSSLSAFLLPNSHFSYSCANVRAIISTVIIIFSFSSYAGFIFLRYVHFFRRLHHIRFAFTSIVRFLCSVFTIFSLIFACIVRRRAYSSIINTTL